jgi:hypothetical protein
MAKTRSASAGLLAAVRSAGSTSIPTTSSDAQQLEEEGDVLEEWYQHDLRACYTERVGRERD